VSPDLPDGSEDSRARRRAALTLAGVVLVAVIVGLLMVTLSRTSSGNKQAALPSVRTSAEGTVALSLCSPAETELMNMLDSSSAPVGYRFRGR